MAKKPINCFVAMAFGRDDCDAVYDRQIHPTLKKLGIDPIKVDRKQHRDDLNNFIIRKLKDSEIVLADLTYARPSVYYEAGFAERMVPVVYTARFDHLNRGQPDDSLRVHFDLEMKKIVHWKHPGDHDFSKRLTQRISYLIKPMQTRRAKHLKAEKERKAFLGRSVADRCEVILGAFVAQLRAKRFWVQPLLRLTNMTIWELKPSLGVVGAKMVGTKCILCIVLAGESIPKKQIQYTIHRLRSASLVTDKRNGGITECENYYYFCSLKKLPESRVTSAFPRAKPGTDPGTYEIAWDGSSTRHPTIDFIFLVSAVDSETDIRNRARALIAKHSSKRNNKYTQLVKSHGYRIENKILFS